MSDDVVVVQDHLVQRGGAERVLLGVMSAFPNATLRTSFFWPEATYTEFGAYDVRPMFLDRLPALRRHHRALLPLFPVMFSAMKVDADVVVCGSAGWAQGVRTTGRKLVYFHALAAWLHAPEHYLSSQAAVARFGLAVTRPALRRWDLATGRSGDAWAVYGRWMQHRVKVAYGVDAEVLPPPMAVTVDGPERAVPGVAPGFFLSPSRLMPYKNLDRVLAGFALTPGERLVVAGEGPERERLEAMAPPNVQFIGNADDAALRWLYRNCRAIVSAGVEAYGLTPVEAAAFGKGAVAFDFGGLTDTVTAGVTGEVFEVLEPEAIAAAVKRYDEATVDAAALSALVEAHSLDNFVTQLRSMVDRLRSARAG